MSSDKKGRLEIESKANYWIHTARPVLVLGLNVFVVVPILIFLFHPKAWVAAFAAITICALVLMRIYRVTPIVAWRAILSYLAGKTVKRNYRLKNHRIWK